MPSFNVKLANLLCEKIEYLCHAFCPNHTRSINKLRLITFNCADKNSNNNLNLSDLPTELEILPTTKYKMHSNVLEALESQI